MIGLKEAREKVVNVVGEENIPSYTSLRNWVSNGIISGKIEGSRMKAKYPDRIEKEIIAAIELKNEKDIKLKTIVKFRNKIGLNNVKDINEYYDLLIAYGDELKEKNKKIGEFNISSDDPDGKVKELQNQIKKVEKLGKELDFLEVYASIFKEK